MVVESVMVSAGNGAKAFEFDQEYDRPEIYVKEV
jgi:hypothetical protein